LRNQDAEHQGKQRRAQVTTHPAHAGRRRHLVLAERIRGDRIQRPRQGLVGKAANAQQQDRRVRAFDQTDTGRADHAAGAEYQHHLA